MAYHPWQKYYDLFSSLFSRDMSQEAPDPSSLSGAGIGRADGVGNAEYLEGGNTFNHAIEINSLHDFLEVGEHSDRRARLLEYDRLENIPEISSALDTYADEVTVPDTDRKVFTIEAKNQAVKEELEWLFNDALRINDGTLWSWSRNLCKNGDVFVESIVDPDHPELGVQRVAELPPETIYRIETVKGRLIEFQQSYMGPDYMSVINDINAKMSTRNDAIGDYPPQSPVTTTGTMANPMGPRTMNAVIRFTKDQITHFRIGTRRRGFYPYGISILYAGRRVAHLLKLMEDAMVVYRLTRAPERKVFYIDVGLIPPNKGEQTIERIKDKLKKKKIYNKQTGQVDERYNPWAADEDFFLPTRPESNTRIETLPGGQNLGEIDDTKYFREKLMVSLKLPKNYLFQDDVATNRMTISAQDMRFARAVYRIQLVLAAGLKQIGMNHLRLKGFAEEDQKFDISFTAPSDFLELSRMELVNGRYNLAASIKGNGIFDLQTIHTKILKLTREESLEIIARLEQQTMREMELQMQSQALSQLMAAEMNPQPPAPGTPGAPGGEGVPAAPEGQSPEAVPPQPAQPQPAPTAAPIAAPAKPKRRKLGIDALEADEEELDLGY